MDKLKMHIPDKTKENFEKLAVLFPNAVTETIVKGEVVCEIDADILQQETSAVIVAGTEERYQFTWPDKKKYYTVFCDASFTSDSVAANFEQIFATYSPTTERRML